MGRCGEAHKTVPEEGRPPNFSKMRRRSLNSNSMLMSVLFSIIVVISWELTCVSGSVAESVSRSPYGIPYEKPRIKLSVIEVEFGGVVSSSKTLIDYTDSNMTKIIEEDKDGTMEPMDGENDLEGDDEDNQNDGDDGVRPGGRNGATSAQRRLRLECVSNFPVEIGYEGYGAPYNITTKAFRQVKNFTDFTSYTYSTVLDFSSNAERHTGLYVCGPVRNASVNATQMLEGAPVTAFRLFVKGKTLFFSRRNATIELSRGDTSFLVPCPISNPSAYSSVKLYRVQVDGNKMIPALLDMNNGFHVFVKPGEEGLRHADGSYVCKDNTGRSSPHYKVTIPKEIYSRVTPDVNFVHIIPGQTQVFKCEAKDGNVTLTFMGDRQPRPPRQVKSVVNDSSEYPYVAMYEVNPMEITSEHTIINCVRTDDGKILHTWEYSTYADVSISRFFFDGNKRYQDARYICCSESYYKPKLEYILCRTETECELKKRILDEDDGSELKESLLEEYAVRIGYANSTCVTFKPHFKYTLQTGMLRCSVQGISRSVLKDYLYYFNPYRVYQAFTDDRFDHLKVMSSDSIMKMSKTPSKNTLIGQKTRFLCYYSELFIANGIVWSLEMKNGSMAYFDQSENQQMGNTSFSQIEIPFDNTDVSVIRCHAPVRASPYEWRNLSGPIFVRDLPSIKATWLDVNGLNEKVISGNLSESRNLILEAPLIPSLDGLVVLECNASFPVDWVYAAGEGLPEMDFQAIRYTDQLLTNYKDYTYSAKLKFFKVNKQIVGKYSCISANREFGHRGKEEDLKADFFVYVPGGNIFTNEQNQTVRVWEYRDSVLIPCPITDPRINVTLNKFNNETNAWDNIDPTGKILDYSPMAGFLLSKNATSSLFGTYRCEAKKNETNQTSGVFSVILPFDPATRLTPFQKQVKIFPNETQLFKCEAKEEVTLVFSDHNEREILHEYTDWNHQFPYSATYETEIDEFSNFTIINCTTKSSGNETGKVLHTWEFYPDDPNFIDSFNFDNSTGQLVCCSKPYRDPIFEWMNCSSISECYSRQSPCLRQNKCQSAHIFLPGEIDYSQKDKGCIAMNITEKPQGFVRCVVTGIHKIVTQAYMYYYNVEENYEIHDGYFLAPKVFEKFAVPSEKIMKIGMGLTKKENITVGESVRFFCSASKFFSGKEIRWAFERSNGTVEYMFGRDLSTYAEVESEVRMTFEDPDWAKVYCFAPNWNEYYGWRNVSLPLIVSQ